MRAGALLKNRVLEEVCKKALRPAASSIKGEMRKWMNRFPEAHPDYN